MGWPEERAQLLGTAQDMLKTARTTLETEIPQLVAQTGEQQKQAALVEIYEKLTYASLANTLQNPPAATSQE